MSKSDAKGVSETQALQLEFWQTFKKYAENIPGFSSIFNFQKPMPQHWYTFTVGSSEFHLNLTVNSKEKRVGVDIYISDNKDLFRKLKSKQENMENFLGMRLEYVEATKVCRIKTFYSGDIRDRDSWDSLFEWFTNTTIKFKELISQLT